MWPKRMNTTPAADKRGFGILVMVKETAVKHCMKSHLG